MLRVVLSILAVIGLLLSPIHAQAAEADCAAMDARITTAAHVAAAMDMSSCCDKDLAKTAKTDAKDKACIGNCITMCGIAVVLDGGTLHATPVLPLEAAAFVAANTAAAASEPALFVPPPRLNA